MKLLTYRIKKNSLNLCLFKCSLVGALKNIFQFFFSATGDVTMDRKNAKQKQLVLLISVFRFRVSSFITVETPAR